MKLRTRRQAGAIGIALAMAGALLVPTPALAADPPLTNPVALERGHIDAFFTALNDDGSVQLMLSDDATGSHINRTPESVDMVVKSAAQQTFSPAALVPSELQGQTVYRLPANQNQNLIWPGWDTNSLKPVYGDDVSVDFAVEVAGPGTVWAWYQNEEGEPATHLTSGDFTVSPADTIRQPYPSHTHTNWAFSAAGTYNFTVTAHVSGNGLTATSNTATYTFVVAPTLEITGLQGSYADGSAIELTAASPVEGATYEWSVAGSVVTGQTGPQLSLTAAQDLDGAAVSVRQLGSVGTEIAVASAVTLNVDEPAPTQTLEITGLRAHYHQDRPIVLDAVAAPEAPGASYEWFMQRVDQSAPVLIAGQNGAQLTITSEQAFDNAQVTARVLDADGAELAVAPAVVIDIDDHGAPPVQTVTISGAAHHYHSGATAHLSAGVSPASVLNRYEWQVQNAGEDTWTAIAGAPNSNEHSFEVTEALDGAHVRAVLTYDDGTPYVASAPVEIAIDDHHDDDPVETSLSIDGLAAHYHTGDIANLTAVQDPQTEENHYHWFVKRASDLDYTVIPGALSETLEYTVLAEDQGAQIIVRLYGHDHGVLAESDPATIAIDDHHGDGDGDHDGDGDGDENAKPTTAPAEPGAGALDGIPAGGITLDKSEVEQGGIVRVQVGTGTEHAGEWVAAWMFSSPVLLGGDWQLIGADGSILVRIPANATTGVHSIAVYDAAGDLMGWQPIKVTGGDSGHGAGGAGGSGAKGLAKTGSDVPLVALGGFALLMLAGGAALLLARRRRAATEE